MPEVLVAGICARTQRIRNFAVKLDILWDCRLSPVACRAAENSSGGKDMLKHMSLSLNLICFVANTHTHTHTRLLDMCRICKSHKQTEIEAEIGKCPYRNGLASIWLRRPQLEGIMNAFIKHNNGQTVREGEREGVGGKPDKSPFEKQLQSV